MPTAFLLPGIIRSADAAVDFCGEAVDGIDEGSSAFHFRLDISVSFTVNDCFMTVGHVILWQFPVIFHLVFLDRVGFLWDDEIFFLLLIVSVTEDALVRNANLARLEPLADAPFAVFGQSAWWSGTAFHFGILPYALPPPALKRLAM